MINNFVIELSSVSRTVFKTQKVTTHFDAKLRCDVPHPKYIPVLLYVDAKFMAVDNLIF